MNPKLLIPICAVVAVPAILLFQSAPQTDLKTKTSAQNFVSEQTFVALPENRHLTEIENTRPSAGYLDDLKRALKENRAEDIRDSFFHLAAHVERRPESLNEILPALQSDAVFIDGLILLARINSENPTAGGNKLLRSGGSDLARGTDDSQNPADKPNADLPPDKRP